MNHYNQNNLLKLLFLGKNTQSFESLTQLINLDLLPLELAFKSDLTSTLVEFHRDKSVLFPQAIILDIDQPSDQLFRFIEQYELLIAPQASQTLFFLSGTKSSLSADTFIQRFSFITGFIEKPFGRKAIERIASHLLQLSDLSFCQLDLEVA